MSWQYNVLKACRWIKVSRFDVGHVIIWCSDKSNQTNWRDRRHTMAYWMLMELMGLPILGRMVRIQAHHRNMTHCWSCCNCDLVPIASWPNRPRCLIGAWCIAQILCWCRHEWLQQLTHRSIPCAVIGLDIAFWSIASRACRSSILICVSNSGTFASCSYALSNDIYADEFARTICRFSAYTWLMAARCRRARIGPVAWGCIVMVCGKRYMVAARHWSSSSRDHASLILILIS